MSLIMTHGANLQALVSKQIDRFKNNYYYLKKSALYYACRFNVLSTNISVLRVSLVFQTYLSCFTLISLVLHASLVFQTYLSCFTRISRGYTHLSCFFFIFTCCLHLWLHDSYRVLKFSTSIHVNFSQISLMYFEFRISNPYIFNA